MRGKAVGSKSKMVILQGRELMGTVDGGRGEIKGSSTK